MIYLRDKQYYIDLHDLQTIKDCLRWYWDLHDGMEKHRNKLKSKEPDIDFDKEVHKVCSYTVNAIRIERYRHKASTIEEWMERDRKMQTKLDSTTAPKNILCKKCGAATKVTSRDLMNAYENDSKVLFMFECTKCKKRQALYEDGTAWIYNPPKCPKCGNDLHHDAEYTKGKLTTTYSCSICPYKKSAVDDFKEQNKKWKRKKEQERKLLETYRKVFCYDDLEGPKAVMHLDAFKRFSDELKTKEKKEQDPIYQKARKLKILKLNQLKDILNKSVQREGYMDLQFSKPELDRHIIVAFTATDNKDDRGEYDSTNTLKKVIKTTLQETNWRLMSEGIHYRLGIVSGRLKAYEKEEDLMNLVK